MRGIFSKKILKVAFVAALLSLIIITNPAGFFSPLRSVVNLFLLPFQKVSYSVAIGIESTVDFFGSIGQLKNENEQLIKEKEILLSENAKLRDTENENVMLREQLKLVPRDHYELASAFVISQDPKGTGNWIEINRGSDDGIKKGDSVIVSKGIFVGRIQEVELKTSKVVLLTNPSSIINAISIQNNAKGVAKGEYGLGIIFDMIMQTDAIEIGDDIITSGIGGDIPRGLYLGKVQEVHDSNDNLYQQAVINSPVELSKLQVVFVIKSVLEK